MGKSLSIKVKLCVLLLLSSTIILASVSPKALASEVTIYLEPSNYVFSPNNATVGTLFNVTVWVKSETSFNLQMWQVCLTFNKSLIMPVFYNSTMWEEVLPKIWPNDDMGGRSFNSDYVFYGKTGGMISKPYYGDLGGGIGAVQIGDLLFTNASISGEKILCVIQFNITTAPADGALSCALSIDNEDTYLYDTNGPIPYSVVKQNGMYIFIPEFSMFIILATLMSTSISVTIAKGKLRKKPLINS